MSVEQIAIDAAATAAEPVKAVVVDAGAGEISRVIIEKVAKSGSLHTTLVVAGAVSVIAGVSYFGHKGYKAYKARKASKKAAE